MGASLGGGVFAGRVSCEGCVRRGAVGTLEGGKGVHRSSRGAPRVGSGEMLWCTRRVVGPCSSLAVRPLVGARFRVGGGWGGRRAGFTCGVMSEGGSPEEDDSVEEEGSNGEDLGAEGGSGFRGANRSFERAEAEAADESSGADESEMDKGREVARAGVSGTVRDVREAEGEVVGVRKLMSMDSTWELDPLEGPLTKERFPGASKTPFGVDPERGGAVGEYEDPFWTEGAGEEDFDITDPHDRAAFKAGEWRKAKWHDDFTQNYEVKRKDKLSGVDDLSEEGCMESGKHRMWRIYQRAKKVEEEVRRHREERTGVKEEEPVHLNTMLPAWHMFANDPKWVKWGHLLDPEDYFFLMGMETEEDEAEINGYFLGEENEPYALASKPEWEELKEHDPADFMTADEWREVMGRQLADDEKVQKKLRMVEESGGAEARQRLWDSLVTPPWLYSEERDPKKARQLQEQEYDDPLERINDGSPRREVGDLKVGEELQGTVAHWHLLQGLFVDVGATHHLRVKIPIDEAAREPGDVGPVWGAIADCLPLGGQCKVQVMAVRADPPGRYVYVLEGGVLEDGMGRQLPAELYDLQHPVIEPRDQAAINIRKGDTLEDISRDTGRVPKTLSQRFALSARFLPADPQQASDEELAMLSSLKNKAIRADIAAEEEEWFGEDDTLEEDDAIESNLLDAEDEEDTVEEDEEDEDEDGGAVRSSSSRSRGSRGRMSGVEALATAEDDDPDGDMSDPDGIDGGGRELGDDGRPVGEVDDEDDLDDLDDEDDEVLGLAMEAARKVEEAEKEKERKTDPFEGVDISEFEDEALNQLPDNSHFDEILARYMAGEDLLTDDEERMRDPEFFGQEGTPRQKWDGGHNLMRRELDLEKLALLRERSQGLRKGKGRKEGRGLFQANRQIGATVMGDGEEDYGDEAIKYFLDTTPEGKLDGDGKMLYDEFGNRRMATEEELLGELSDFESATGVKGLEAYETAASEDDGLGGEDALEGPAPSLTQEQQQALQEERAALRGGRDSLGEEDDPLESSDDWDDMWFDPDRDLPISVLAKGLWGRQPIGDAIKDREEPEIMVRDLATGRLYPPHSEGAVAAATAGSFEVCLMRRSVEAILRATGYSGEMEVARVLEEGTEYDPEILRPLVDVSGDELEEQQYTVPGVTEPWVTPRIRNPKDYIPEAITRQEKDVKHLPINEQYFSIKPDDFPAEVLQAIEDLENA